MKVIPISEIDKLIEHHEGHGISIEYDDVDVINILKKLKKKAIPAIPISKIDEINELIPWNMTPSCNMAKKKLEDLKK